MKIILRCVEYLILIAVIIVCLIYFTLNTSTGFKTITFLLEKFGHIYIAKITGNINSYFVLKDVYVNQPTLSIKIDQVIVSWHPASLWQAKLDISLLKLDHVVIQFFSKKNVTTKNGLSLDFLKWLKYISLKQAMIKQIQIVNTDNKSTHINFLSIYSSHEKNYSLIMMFPLGKIEALFKNVDGSNRWNGIWSLNLPNLKYIYPDLKGSLVVTGQLQNKKNLPFITANIDISQLSFKKYIQHLQGNFKIEIEWLKKFLGDKINYHFYMANASGDIPLLGLKLKNILIDAQANELMIGKIVAKIRSGQGQLQTHGSFNFSTMTNPFIQLKIQAYNVLALNKDGYYFTLTSNVILAFNQDNLNLRGEVILPIVRVDKPIIHTVIELPNEVVFVNRERNINLLNKLSVDLKLTLGSDIHLIYKKLSASLAGKVHLYQVPGGQLLANGSFKIIEGKYHIYDKFFTIKNGQLIYVGNLLTNPGLNIKAYRMLETKKLKILNFTLANPDIDNLQIGVLIQGTLESPKISLISDPPMAQADILSYIVFGQARGNLTSASGLSLLEALASNNDMQVAADSTTSPLGGLISIFKTGLFDANQVLSLDFPISKNIRFQTQAGIKETGADILYQQEFGK